MKKLFISLSLTILTLAVSSCGSTKETDPIALITGTSWQLSSINGQAPVASQYARGLPYINFTADNKVNGNGGCNGFSGAYNLNQEGGINISQVVSTKMACEGNGENDFFNALTKVNMTKIDDNKLVLLSGIDEILVFIPNQSMDN